MKRESCIPAWVGGIKEESEREIVANIYRAVAVFEFNKQYRDSELEMPPVDLDYVNTMMDAIDWSIGMFVSIYELTMIAEAFYASVVLEYQPR